MKKILLIFSTILIIFTCVSCGNSDDVVLYVNDVPVYKQELEMHMKLNEIDVAVDLENEYGIDYSHPQFWYIEIADGKAVDFLINQAVDEISEWHIQFNLAANNNLEKCHRDYHEWQKEYENYLDELRNNSFGITDNISFETYMAGKISEIKIQLIALYSGNVCSVTESEVVDYYNNHKEEITDSDGNVYPLDEVREDITNEITEQKYVNYIESLKEDAKIIYSDNFENIKYTF